MTVREFLERHEACAPGLTWAVANCATMQEVWDTARPEWLVWLAEQPRVLTTQQQRKFACWCVRQVWHLLTDERSKNAVEVAERHADGMATDEELDAARDAASDAAYAAADAVSRAASWAAAEAADYATASAAFVAAEAAAYAAAEAAARAAQAAWLRTNCVPCFDLEGDQ